MATDSIRKSIFANVIEGKAIVIGCIREESFLVLHGSTMQSSVASNSPGEHPKSITFYPKQDEEGIIALVIYAFTHRSGRHDHAQFNEIPVFLKITWKQDGETKKPLIDLENPWYPADHIGQVQKDHVEVCINGKRFASYDHAQWNFNEKKNCPVFVKDGDLLVRYLFKEATEEEVIAAAGATEEAAHAPKRVKELGAEVTRLKDNLAKNESYHNSRFANLEHEFDVLKLDHASTLENIDELTGYLRGARSDVEIEKLLHKGAERTLSCLIEDMKLEWLYKLLKRLPSRLRPASLDWVFWVYEVLVPQAKERKACSETVK